jgi:signal peptidase I
VSHQDIAGRVPGAGPPQPAVRGRLRRGVRRTAFWMLVCLATGLLVASVAILVLGTRGFSDTSPTMEPAISTGDRLFVAAGTSIRRGDVVVLHRPATATSPDSTYVKRVIGLPGDHVACCDASGRVTVNSRPLHEGGYLYPGNRPSRRTFSVTLGPGQIWVMGDRRNLSADSREWGPVRLSGVVGRVILVVHGSSVAALKTPQAFVSAGLAPADTRLDHYLRLAYLAAACAAALLILTIAGIISLVIRGRRSGRAADLLTETG